MGENTDHNELTMLPLRDVVVYPHMVIPLFVGREKSILALEEAMVEDKKILLVAQKSAAVDDPEADDLYRVGTLSSVLQMLKLPDGTVKVLVEGTERVKINTIDDSLGYFVGNYDVMPSETLSGVEADALMRSALTQFELYVNPPKW